MLCTPWLTINICFVFLMPTRGTYSLQKDGSWDWMERDAYWLFSVLFFLNVVSNLFTLAQTAITRLCATQDVLLRSSDLEFKITDK